MKDLYKEIVKINKDNIKEYNIYICSLRKTIKESEKEIKRLKKENEKLLKKV